MSERNPDSGPTDFNLVPSEPTSRLISTDTITVTGSRGPLTWRMRAVLYFNAWQPFGFVLGTVDGKRRMFRW